MPATRDRLINNIFLISFNAVTSFSFLMILYCCNLLNCFDVGLLFLEIKLLIICDLKKTFKKYTHYFGACLLFNEFGRRKGGRGARPEAADPQEGAAGAPAAEAAAPRTSGNKLTNSH